MLDNLCPKTRSYGKTRRFCIHLEYFKGCKWAQSITPFRHTLHTKLFHHRCHSESSSNCGSFVLFHSDAPPFPNPKTSFVVLSVVIKTLALGSSFTVYFLKVKTWNFLVRWTLGKNVRKSDFLFRKKVVCRFRHKFWEVGKCLDIIKTYESCLK